MNQQTQHTQKLNILLLLIGFALLAHITHADQTSAQTVSPISSEAWQEVVISVTDLDRSAEFFLKVAGYNIRWRGDMSAGELRSFGLPKEVKAEALLLGHLDHESGLIRLVRFDNAGKKEPMRPGSRAWDTGCYFSVMVRAKKLRDLYDQAISLGWWSETPVTPLEFGPSKLDVVVLQGSDGLQVQAYERLSPPLPEEVGEFKRLTRPFNIMQMVKSRDDAFDFFSNVLGFESWFAGPPYYAKQPEYSPIGIPFNLTPEVGYHAAIVYPKPGEFGRLEMIDIIGLDGRDHSQRCHAPNLGILSVRFKVDDVRAARSTIKQRNWPIKHELVPAKITPYEELEIISINSPDGALISFFGTKK